MSWLRKASLTCLVLYWAILFLGTHLPGGSIPDVKTSDKVQHWVAFAVLSFLITATVAGRKAPAGRIVAAVTLAITYATVDEWTQRFIPQRSSDLWDWVADAGGVLAGAGCYVLSYLALRAVGWIRPEETESERLCETDAWYAETSKEPA